MSKNQEQDDKAAAAKLHYTAEQMKKFFGDVDLEPDPESGVEWSNADFHVSGIRATPSDEIHSS